MPAFEVREVETITRTYTIIAATAEDARKIASAPKIQRPTAPTHRFSEEEQFIQQLDSIPESDVGSNFSLAYSQSV